jgi:hypothetical protein
MNTVIDRSSVPLPNGELAVSHHIAFLQGARCGVVDVVSSDEGRELGVEALERMTDRRVKLIAISAPAGRRRPAWFRRASASAG